jgi:hypothetical protein
MSEPKVFRLLAYAVGVSILIQFVESVEPSNPRASTLAFLQALAHAWIPCLYWWEGANAERSPRRKENGPLLLLHLLAGACAIATIIARGVVECGSPELAWRFVAHSGPLCALELTVVAVTVVKIVRWMRARLRKRKPGARTPVSQPGKPPVKRLAPPRKATIKRPATPARKRRKAACSRRVEDTE